MNALPLCPPASADGRSLPAVAVIGEALVDRFADAEHAGGAPFNLARALAAFGVPVTMITRIGCGDAGAGRVLASARRFGLDEAGFQRDPVRGTGAVAVLERGAEHGFRIAGDAAWDAIELAPARQLLRRRPPAVLCVGTLAQRSAVSRHAVQTLLGETPALRFLDVNLRAGHDNRPLAASALAQADWVKVNEDELGHLVVWFAPRRDAAAPAGSAERQAAIQELMGRFGLQRLVVTRGARGYEAWDARGGCIARGDGVALPHVVDTVGAGDAFSAALLALHGAGRTFAQALEGANRYAAAVCAERGAVPEDDEFFCAWRWTLGLHRPLAQAA